MPFSDYSSPCESTSDGLPKEQQTSREWVLEWNRKSDTSEVQEYLQQLQRSHSHSHPENADSPESFSRSSSVPRYTGFDGQADVEMESEPWGSLSIISTRAPRACSTWPKVMVEVVLATPPF